MDSNISNVAKFGGVKSWFYRFLKLYSLNEFFVAEMASLISLLNINVSVQLFVK
jgi:hypothetical protein